MNDLERLRLTFRPLAITTLDEAGEVCPFSDRVFRNPDAFTDHEFPRDPIDLDGIVS
jgi:hypothetical protein